VHGCTQRQGAGFVAIYAVLACCKSLGGRFFFNKKIENGIVEANYLQAFETKFLKSTFTDALLGVTLNHASVHDMARITSS